MAKTALDLTPAERKKYQMIKGIQARRKALQPQIDTRLYQAKQLANQAANILYEQFNADRVLLFGSTVKPTKFTPWSDIDLAVSGIPSRQFYKAFGAIEGLSTDIGIDFVDIEDCRPEVRASIMRDGVEL